MPVHTVLLISVEVAEKRVEGVASELFNALLQHGQQRMPLQSAQTGTVNARNAGQGQVMQDRRRKLLRNKIYCT